jgi:hypothetical protein
MATLILFSVHVYQHHAGGLAQSRSKRTFAPVLTMTRGVNDEGEKAVVMAKLTVVANRTIPP